MEVLELYSHPLPYQITEYYQIKYPSTNAKENVAVETYFLWHKYWELGAKDTLSDDFFRDIIKQKVNKQTNLLRKLNFKK